MFYIIFGNNLVYQGKEQNFATDGSLGKIDNDTIKENGMGYKTFSEAKKEREELAERFIKVSRPKISKADAIRKLTIVEVD